MMPSRFVTSLGLALVLLQASPLLAAAEKGVVPIADSAFSRSLEYTGNMIQEPGWHIWGCSPIVGEDGKVHLFVERWPVRSATHPRNFDESWRHDSEIAHYVGPSPEGPFVFRDVALKGTGAETWDRFGPGNPSIQKIDGKYALVYIGNPIGMTKGMGAHPTTQRIGLALADSPDGPWRKVGVDGKVLDPSPNPKHWTYGGQVVNPALLRHPDGRYLLYYKGKGAKMGVAIATKLEGPYLHEPTPFTRNDRTIEDGYAFATGGKFYFLTTDNHGIGIRGGGLLWQSADGVVFDPTPMTGFKTPRFYLPTVDPKQVRSYYAAGTFQRPQVLMRDGKPAYLYVASGTVINGGDGTVCYVLRCKDAPDAGGGSAPR